MSLAEKAAEDSPDNLIEPRVSLLLTKISNVLTEQDIQSYVVGGFVRDVLLGRDTADIDIAVEADATEIAPKVATALGGKYVLLDKVNRVGRVVLLNKEAPSTRGQWELDFSTVKGSIKQDLARRDFTIDAIAVDLRKIAIKPLPPILSPLKKKGEVPAKPAMLIDPFNGWNDLHQQVIRAVA